MRIDDGNKLTPAHQIDRGHDSVARRPVDKAADSKSDLGSISDVAAQASSVNRASQQRLEALRLAVESGSYDVSASALALKLIDFHLGS